MAQLDTIETAVTSGTVTGSVSDRFRPVLDAFVENFRTRGEVGAGLYILHEGEVVVSAWGGRANPREAKPWVQQTIVPVFSCTKAALAFCAHWLAERGRLDLDAPVMDVWPNYATGGKQATTTRMMLDHTAGVPAFRDPVKAGGFLDWAYMVDRIAAEPAFFEPGTRGAYHGLTYAWTVGEVIRRTAGMSASALFAQEFAEPLGLDFWIGLPDTEEERLARVLPARIDASTPQTAFAKAVNDRSSIPGLFLFNDGGFNPNRRDYRAAEIGSANGVASAEGLARLYLPASLGGRWNGMPFFSPERVAQMAVTTNASHFDATLCLPTRFGPGFMHSMDNRHLENPPAGSVILSQTAFGHGGAGGSIGFADPATGLAFGYVMNQMGLGQLLNARGQALIDAAFTVLGYRPARGAWMPPR